MGVRPSSNPENIDSQLLHAENPQHALRVFFFHFRQHLGSLSAEERTRSQTSDRALSGRSWQFTITDRDFEQFVERIGSVEKSGTRLPPERLFCKVVYDFQMVQ